MKKLNIILLLLLTILLSSCSKPYTFYYDINANLNMINIIEYDEDIYVNLFYVYPDISEFYSSVYFSELYLNEKNLAYNIVTKQEVTIEYSCNDEVFYTNTIKPSFFIVDYAASISNNNLVGVCDMNTDVIDVSITNTEGITLFTFEIPSLDDYYSQPHYMMKVVYTKEVFDYITYLYIGIFLILMGFGVGFIYFDKYRYHVNLKLADPSYKKHMVHPPKFMFFLILIITVIFTLASALSEIIYNKTHHDWIYYSPRTTEIFNVDIETLELIDINFFMIEINDPEATNVDDRYIKTEYTYAANYEDLDQDIIALIDSLQGDKLEMAFNYWDYYGLDVSDFDDTRYTINLTANTQDKIEIVILIPDEAPDEIVCRIKLLLGEELNDEIVYERYLYGYVLAENLNYVNNIIETISGYDPITLD